MNATPSKTKLQLTAADVKKIEEYLLTAPPPPKILSIKDCLIELIPALREARARGHTADSLREILVGIGLKVSTRHVTDALSTGESVRKPQRESARKLTKKSKAEAAQAAAAGAEGAENWVESECYDPS